MRGLVFGLKLNVMSFVTVYGNFKLYIYTVKSCNHISLKSFELGLFAIIFASSVNNIGTVLSFMVLGKSLTHIRNSSEPKTDP